MGHVAGKAKALVTDLDAPRKASQVIDNLGAPNRQNTFHEAVQLHEAENTLAAAQKAHLEQKQSDTGPLTQEESSALDKANATLARHAPRDRGPLPAIPDARRDIQDLSAKAAAGGTLNADEAHQLAHAQRAIAQRRVNDLTALGTALTPQQQGQLAQFQKILAASPYGTELPKGPPPGYDPHATNPAHREWYPPHGDKPVHPTSDKFTPEALALSDNEIKSTVDRMRAQGHAHGRHGPEVTEGQLENRVEHTVDPISQTREDGVRLGKNHKPTPDATQFTSERAMTQALKKVESSPQFKAAVEDAKQRTKDDPSNPVDTVISNDISLESALGQSYLEHVRGKSRTGPPSNPGPIFDTNLTGGFIKAIFVRDPATGEYHIHTMYPIKR